MESKGSNQLKVGVKRFFHCGLHKTQRTRQSVWKRPLLLQLVGDAYVILERTIFSKERSLYSNTYLDLVVLTTQGILGSWDPQKNCKHLWSFEKVSKVTKVERYIFYTWICVYMNIVGALPVLIVVSYQDEEWTQPLYYENIPFRCRKCHVHGHVFMDYHLNNNNLENKLKEEMEDEGLTKIQSKRKVGKHTPKQQTITHPNNLTNNF